MAHLNGAGDQNFVVNAPTLAACPAADPAFVHLDMLVCAATDAVLVRAHHSGAQLMENLKSCLVPRDPKLALQLDSRHAVSLAGDQVGGPKPSGQWRVAALHDRANRQPGLTSAFAACQYARASRDVEWDARHPTVRTDKTVLPIAAFRDMQHRLHYQGRAADRGRDPATLMRLVTTGRCMCQPDRQGFNIQARNYGATSPYGIGPPILM